MKRELAWATFGLVGGLLAAGLILLLGRPPRGQAVTLRQPPTAVGVSIHVTGAVAQPGVYTLPPGSRVSDALQAAGGMLPEANDLPLNLAAVLQDGQKVLVPTRVPTKAPTATTDPAQPTLALGVRAEPLATATLPWPLNINTATLEELDLLPGIGPVLAQAIIDYRDANGPFANIEAIQDVPGIGPGKFEQIKDLITVGEIP
jgi:competence protein ComEA